VLTVARVTDRTGAYYLADLATELSLWSPANPARCGSWVGAGAAGLGLRGPVGAQALSGLLSGASPATGHTLVVRLGAVRAYDLTISAPKSVSVLFALGEPNVASEVLRAHERSVHETLGYLEGHALAVRRGSGEERRSLPAQGFCGAEFTHGISRALDPHLHSHVVVANLAHGVDGRWSAIDGRGLHAHARAAGALYEAHLRHELHGRLGVVWTAHPSGYRIDGIDPLVLAGFSGRSAEIRTDLARFPRATKRSERIAWAATREPKATGVDPEELRRVWAVRAAGLGFDDQAISQLYDRPPSRESELNEFAFAAALIGHGTGLVARRDVLGAWSASCRQGSAVTEITGCVDRLIHPAGEVSVAEALHAPAGVVAAPAALRVLGARPLTSDQLATWQRGALDVTTFVRRWGPEALVGLEDPDAAPPLSAVSARCLVDRLSLERSMKETLRQLGRHEDRGCERMVRDLHR